MRLNFSVAASIEAIKSARKSLHQNSTSEDSIRRLAHTLRISAAHFGFSELKDLAQKVESAPLKDLEVVLNKLLLELQKMLALHGPGDRAHVLVVESDPQMGKLIESLLAAPDREIILTARALDALAILETTPVGLIILDLSLPDMDGRNLLVHVRERAATAGIPVIVLSSLGGAQPKTECFALGADAYFERPVAPDVLKAVVATRLHKSASSSFESRQDLLTGLSNRAAFCEGFARAISLAERKKEFLSFALLDFDLLKRINDSLGHVTGDAVLRHGAHAFSEGLRKSDFLARWGGDKFALILPNTAILGARVTVEKMFSTLAASPFRTQDGRPVPLSFSAGLISIKPGMSVENAFSEADRFLYMAKCSGRGRLVSESDPVLQPKQEILLAEGDDKVSSVIAASLEREGFPVHRCSDGVSVLNALSACPYALLILDLRLDSLTGTSLLLQIKHLSRRKKIPVLMLTEIGKEVDIARGFENGADDYLLKPFSPYNLMSRVHKLLRA